MKAHWGLPLVLLFLAAGCLSERRQSNRSVPEGYEVPQATWPGKQADGSVLLHNQWSIRPAGQQVDLGDFPVNVAVHPSSRYAAVLHAGYGGHQVQIVDLELGRVLDAEPVRETFYGLVFTRDGKTLYCSGAGDEVVHEFQFLDGNLTPQRQIRLREPSQRAVVGGLTLSRSGELLFAANLWGHRVTRLSLRSSPSSADFLLGTNTAALLPAPVQPPSDSDSASITKRDQATMFPSDPADSFPYTCLVDETRGRLYVSLWAQASVAVLHPETGELQAIWPAEDHPCEMVLSRSGKYLFVANANRNTVTLFDADAGKAIETIWSALYPKALPGSTPNSLALSPDEKTLYVANADNNAVAVFDVSRPGRSRSLGFIPVGWYPTSVRVTPDGGKLLVANGRGLTPKANPQGPQPGLRRPSTNATVEYIGGLYQGSLSIIDLPERKEFSRALARYTAQAYRSTPLKPDSSVPFERPKDSPVPQRPGDKTPIKYCLYIVKENRTYDQVLGDMPEGRGDPKLCLFPERVTPNHHKLAREFILLDNFYVNSEVSADGHEWSMGAYATDFVKKSWPLSYGHNRTGKYPYPSEGNFPIASPSGGYLWDRARQAGVTYRSYGEFVANGRTPNDPGRAKVKSLEGHFDPMYRSFDMNYPDVKRAERYLEELNGFEKKGEMPRLQIIRLPNDHTSGTAAGTRTPIAHVADNDLALGMIIEAVTHSIFWPQTAIFVLEDDAQNGPDHVDAHRSVAYVISPYTRRGVVDSTMYSTTSMLRTMELILGLQPMTQHDAAARPMYSAFQAEPDARPYKALPANVDLDERNPSTAWGSQFEMNLAVEDAADDLLLNEVVWRSVKGADSPMPPPVRAAFVMARESAADDDD